MPNDQPNDQPNILQWIKLGMLVVGCTFGAVIGARDVMTALRETEPTRFTIDELADDYAGQHWIAIEGRIAREHAQLEPSDHEAHRDARLGYVHVPVVGERWDGSTSVGVIATFGPVDMAAPIDWAALCPSEPCVVGEIRPVPLDDLAGRFPGVPFAAEPIIVNVGTEPSPPLLMGGFTLFMIIVGLAGAVALIRPAPPPR